MGNTGTTDGYIEALQKDNARLREEREGLLNFWKWLERAWYAPELTGGHKEAIWGLMHHPSAPWNNGRWNVDHKPYGDQLYKDFPKAALNTDKSASPTPRGEVE